MKGRIRRSISAMWRVISEWFKDIFYIDHGYTPSIIDEDFTRIFGVPKQKEPWEMSSPNTLSQKGRRKRARQAMSCKGRNKKRK